MCISKDAREELFSSNQSERCSKPGNVSMTRCGGEVMFSSEFIFSALQFRSSKCSTDGKVGADLKLGHLSITSLFRQGNAGLSWLDHSSKHGKSLRVESLRDGNGLALPAQ